jgi:threonylcarbamoyladenosine tRNA methylthiotransferase MtaB
MAASGFSCVDDHAQSDFVILNSCTVTAAADAQAREAVRKIHRLNPGARIVVTGCYAQRAPEEIAQIEGVAWVVGNSHQAQIPELIQRGVLRSLPADTSRRDFVPLAQIDDEAMSLARGPAKILTGDIFAQTSVPVAPDGGIKGDRTRPILKIQDGCSNRCSYCVIPFVRGRSRSLAPEAVLAEVGKLVAAGAKEVVLSGINLGSYGRDFSPRVGLPEVVSRILRETSLERLRFSSVEPQDVTEEFVALVASSERLARHFHIPLQSGSEKTLKAMHRWYRPALYAERIWKIHHMLRDAAIGADVIVGFPGESDDDFRETFEFIRSLPLAYLHVFSFSVRPGTEAAGLKSDTFISAAVIRDRARALRELSRQKAAEFRAAQAGRTMRAITLARGGSDWTEALTSNYLKVQVAGRHEANLWFDVEVMAETKGAGAENTAMGGETQAVSLRR